MTNAVVPAGSYVLSESGGVPGYTPGAWTCSGGTQSGSTITLAAGQSASCVITNTQQPAVLTLRKSVVNDNGGTRTASEWTLSANGPSTISGATGATAVTAANVNPGVYTLSETGPAGYTASAWSCTAGTLSGNQLTLLGGQNATCSITNNDQPATLTLTKVVVNDNGGTATVGDFVLRAGATVFTSGTAQPINAGVHVLSESGPGGYVAGAWSCTAGSLSGSSLTLAPGMSASCSITNNDSNEAALGITKTNTPAAGESDQAADSVTSGDMVTYTIVVRNDGPAAAHGAVVRDTPDNATLDCTAATLPAPTCAASGGATCPAGPTVAQLAAGVAIPALPNGGSVTLTLTCRVR